MLMYWKSQQQRCDPAMNMKATGTTYKNTQERNVNYQRRPNYHLQQEHNYNYQKNGQSQPRGCYFWSQTNHTMQQCKFGQKITCNFCKKLGHKEKFCKARGFSYGNNYYGVCQEGSAEKLDESNLRDSQIL